MNNRTPSHRRIAPEWFNWLVRVLVRAVGDSMAGGRDVLSGTGSRMTGGQQQECKTYYCHCSEIAHGMLLRPGYGVLRTRDAQD